MGRGMEGCPSTCTQILKPPCSKNYDLAGLLGGFFLATSMTPPYPTPVPQCLTLLLQSSVHTPLFLEWYAIRAGAREFPRTLETSGC